MAPNVRPRGPLPARVYWTRRLVVLGVPLLLVVVLARVLGGSADGEDPGQATQASSKTEASTAPTQGPTAKTDPKGKRAKKKRRPVLAQPTGECEPSDIVATPDVSRVAGGSDVRLRINLRTRTTAACTWQVSPETFTVTITSGSDHIWSTRECVKAVPTRDLVVRSAVDAAVGVTWHARRSDETCSRYTDWARPGYYHVQAAALGGDATDVQFRLVPPSPSTIIKTVPPKPRKDKSRQDDPSRPRDFKPGEGGPGSDG